jgi:hypothetical protein
MRWTITPRCSPPDLGGSKAGRGSGAAAQVPARRGKSGARKGRGGIKPSTTELREALGLVDDVCSIRYAVVLSPFEGSVETLVHSLHIDSIINNRIP